MTPQTIGIALITSLIVGLVVGFVTRHRRDGSIVATTIAMTLGLVLFQTQSPADLANVLAPKSAIAWMPWICLVCLTWGLLPLRHRVTNETIDASSGDIADHANPRATTLLILAPVALAIGAAAVLRLLWGSIYLREVGSLPSTTVILIFVWITAVALPMISPPADRVTHAAAPNRWEYVVWGIVVASITALIAMTGSLTYAVATATMGTSMLGSLLGSGRLVVLSATPLLLMVGLATAFSELPAVSGILTGLALIGLTAAWHRWPSSGWVKPFELAAIANVLVVLLATVAQFRSEVETEYAGYGTPSAGAADHETSGGTFPDSPPPSSAAAPLERADGLPDPFGGFGP